MEKWCLTIHMGRNKERYIQLYFNTESDAIDYAEGLLELGQKIPSAMVKPKYMLTFTIDKVE